MLCQGYREGRRGTMSTLPVCSKGAVHIGWSASTFDAFAF